MPASAMLLIVSGPDPVFLKVATCGVLVAPVAQEPNARLDGVRLTPGAGAAPVPVRLTDSGLLSPLSVICTAALLVPAAEGVNVTLMVQLAPIASVLGLRGQVLPWAKSDAFAPCSVISVIASAAVPILLTVTVFDALVVPVVCEANVRELGRTDAAGVGVEGRTKRLRMFAVTFWPAAFATLWSQSQNPSA